MSRLKKILLFSLMAVGIFLAGSYFWLEQYQKYCFSDLAMLPENKVGLILGTAPRLADGRANLFFSIELKRRRHFFQSKRLTFC